MLRDLFHAIFKPHLYAYRKACMPYGHTLYSKIEITAYQAFLDNNKREESYTKARNILIRVYSFWMTMAVTLPTTLIFSLSLSGGIPLFLILPIFLIWFLFCYLCIHANLNSGVSSYPMTVESFINQNRPE